MYQGVNQNYYSFPADKRIIAHVFPTAELNAELENFETYNFRERVRIMVNCDSQPYAMSYILFVDSASKKLRITIDQKPELGEKLISIEELDGIEVNF